MILLLKQSFSPISRCTQYVSSLGQVSQATGYGKQDTELRYLKSLGYSSQPQAGISKIFSIHLTSLVPKNVFWVTHIMGIRKEVEIKKVSLVNLTT